MENWQKLLKKILINKGLSAFETKVLLKISGIPKGEIRSYAWAAQQANRPKAYRAAANAVSKNPFAPFICCHRVIKNNFKIGGYAFGKKTKEKILKSEGLTIKNDTVIIRIPMADKRKRIARNSRRKTKKPQF